MRKLFFVIAMPIFLSAFSVSNGQDSDWVSLFNGKSLTDWKVGNNASTFSVQNGEIVLVAVKMIRPRRSYNSGVTQCAGN